MIPAKIYCRMNKTLNAQAQAESRRRAMQLQSLKIASFLDGGLSMAALLPESSDSCDSEFQRLSIEFQKEGPIEYTDLQFNIKFDRPVEVIYSLNIYI